MTFSKTIIEEISVTSSSKPVTPLSITNPQQDPIFINQMQIFPSSNFATNAIIQIFVNGISQFDTIKEGVGFFKKFKRFNVNLPNNKFNKNAKIDIFAWNPTNGSLIEANVSIFVSEEDKPILEPSEPDQQTEVNFDNLVSGEGTKTSADGGSGIVSTVYTCPVGKIAVVKVLQTRVKVSGSASEIRLLIRGQRIKTWKNDTKNPNNYATTITLDNANVYPTGFAINSRKIWSDGGYPESNLTFEDLQGEKLLAGETIAYDGGFSGNFNGTIDFAYTIEERDA